LRVPTVFKKKSVLNVRLLGIMNRNNINTKSNVFITKRDYGENKRENRENKRETERKKERKRERNREKKRERRESLVDKA